MKTLIQIIEKAGYTTSIANNKLYEELNKLVIKEYIKISIAPIGQCFNLKGKTYNILLNAGGKQNLYNLEIKRKQIQINHLGELISNLFAKENIKEALKLKYSFETPEKCFKCDGKGEISHYKHIANGICFSCMGTGFKLDLK